MTQEFESSYFARFPLRIIQKQGGVYYGETQEHYETWFASRESLKQKLLSDEMVERVDMLQYSKDLKNGGNWQWENEHQPDMVKRYRNNAKAALQSVVGGL